jgi:hypothetical protein
MLLQVQAVDTDAGGHADLDSRNNHHSNLHCQHTRVGEWQQPSTQPGTSSQAAAARAQSKVWLTPPCRPVAVTNPSSGAGTAASAWTSHTQRQRRQLPAEGQLHSTCCVSRCGCRCSSSSSSSYASWIVHMKMFAAGGVTACWGWLSRIRIILRADTLRLTWYLQTGRCGDCSCCRCAGRRQRTQPTGVSQHLRQQIAGSEIYCMPCHCHRCGTLQLYIWSCGSRAGGPGGTAQRAWTGHCSRNRWQHTQAAHEDSVTASSSARMGCPGAGLVLCCCMAQCDTELL